MFLSISLPVAGVPRIAIGPGWATLEHAWAARRQDPSKRSTALCGFERREPSSPGPS